MAGLEQAEPLHDVLPEPLPHEGWEVYKRRLTEIMGSRRIVQETGARQERWVLLRSRAASGECEGRRR